MANIFVNLPMPAGDGPGTAIDVSAMGSEKSIVIAGTFTGATISIEISNNGVDFSGFLTFPAEGKKVLPVVARYMRVFVRGRSAEPFYANADVGANDNGSKFVELPVPAGNGAGTPVDISKLGNYTTFIVVANMPGVTLAFEISEDGTDWVSCGASFADVGGLHSRNIIANQARLFVRGRTTLPFTAKAFLGAANDSISGETEVSGPTALDLAVQIDTLSAQVAQLVSLAGLTATQLREAQEAICELQRCLDYTRAQVEGATPPTH